jgi:hypothetical protein
MKQKSVLHNLRLRPLLRRLLLARLLSTRREDRVQRVAFLPRPKLNDAAVADIFDQALQNSASQTGPRHLASAKKDRGLDLVAFIQKTQHVVFLGLVVVIVHVDAELHFFYRDRLLMLLGLALFLFLLVQEFPVIHNAANRGLRGGGNLDQVQILFAGHLERFKRRHDSNLLAFIADHANFACPNTLICADKSLIDAKPPLHVQRRGIEKYSMERLAFSRQPQFKFVIPNATALLAREEPYVSRSERCGLAPPKTQRTQKSFSFLTSAAMHSYRKVPLTPASCVRVRDDKEHPR